MIPRAEIAIASPKVLYCQMGDTKPLVFMVVLFGAVGVAIVAFGLGTWANMVWDMGVSMAVVRNDYR